MKFSMVRFCATFIALSWFVLSGYAAEDVKAVRCSLSAITNNSAIRDLHYLNNGKWETLDVPAARTSQPFDYSGPQQIKFYSEPYSADEAPPPPLGSVRLQGAGTEQLLVFIPRSSDPHRYDIVAIKDDAASFPPRHLLFFNFTGDLIAGAFDNEVVQVDPGKSALFAYDESKTRGMRIQLAIQQKSNNEWKRIYASGVPIFPNVRWLVLCVPAEQRPWLLMVKDRKRAGQP